ncbi:MAG: hypothetical protein HOP20_10895 [Sulfuriferula sp.]|nr:hypothetical protein [Sulfuriferula sp.]
MKTKTNQLDALPATTLTVDTLPTINLIDFDAQQVTTTDITDIADCIPFIHTPTVTWINVDNVHTPALVEQIGAQFNFHPLMLEDIKHTEQRPKYEEYDDCIFIVLKMLDFNAHTHAITIEQLSLVLAPHYLISLFSSIFLPLTLLAGIFGMNFRNFPGLDANNGLPITLVTMLMLGIGMVLFFKYKRWI